MLFQFRDESVEQLEKFERELFGLVDEANKSGPCKCRIDILDKAIPKVMDPEMQMHLENAAREFAPGENIRMPSGAMHDAQVFAKLLPAAMLFVPSIGGISHHWTENTTDEDIKLGGKVFGKAAEDILASHKS